MLITTHNVIRVISHIDENFEAGNSLNLPVNGGCRSTFAGKGLVKKYGGGGGVGRCREGVGHEVLILVRATTKGLIFEIIDSLYLGGYA